ncbi:hypothetical protein GDO81_021887 [Engystomops pustulosus]|uniref:Secreted protein n=1 Tax=Engystomops pustulosus TaxID=76066 RepID=A0AAV6Z9A5_ENGPU|nr:hypothetical protein GDO81_021887 [Engystomops pustulosus]
MVGMALLFHCTVLLVNPRKAPCHTTHRTSYKKDNAAYPEDLVTHGTCIMFRNLNASSGVGVSSSVEMYKIGKCKTMGAGF